MMDGLLSQEEINALLNGITADTSEGNNADDLLNEVERDAVGEVSNISMGTAATTLFSLVNQKVVITTPQVELCDWTSLTKEHDRPCVFIQILYRDGLDGHNILILKEKDVKVITDLMMGGDGSNTEDPLSELHLSAISEAMNQMMGSAATSMSSMFNKKIDISPPISSVVEMNESIETSTIAEFLADTFVKVSFKMEIGDLVNSEIMQLYPLDFAKSLNDMFSGSKEEKSAPEVVEKTPSPVQTNHNQPMQSNSQQPVQREIPQQEMYTNMQNNVNLQRQRDVNAQPAEFQEFTRRDYVQSRENIDLIMDVPLEVAVELGKTHKSIKEILEFSPGTIIELDKLAGEPIDVLVNGKLVAKGEVVVIDENFGIRITEITKYK